MKLSIIIINWNTQHFLKDCLASIFEHPAHCEYDVWVVDNASTDDSIANIEDEFPKVKLIRNTNNVGFGQANNQAAGLAEGDYLLILNPDTLVHAGALDMLVEYLDATPQAAAVGPKLLNADGSLQISAFPAPTLGRELWRLFHLDKIISIGQYPADRFGDKPFKADVLMGACLLIRAELIRKIGLLMKISSCTPKKSTCANGFARAGGNCIGSPMPK